MSFHRQLSTPQSVRVLCPVLIIAAATFLAVENTWLSEFGPVGAAACICIFVLAWLFVRLDDLRKENDRQRIMIDCLMSKAHTDALTGLSNRRDWETELERQAARLRRQGPAFCVLLIDIDHFKSWNDRYGHLVGDQTLRSIANVLTAEARTMDLVARLGGDEFAVMLPATSLSDALDVAQRMRKAAAEMGCLLHGADEPFTVSIGVAGATEEESIASLMARADKALYAAKSAGRDCCYVHDGKRCTRATTAEHALVFMACPLVPKV